MKVIRGLHNLAVQTQGCVATIGNFDGLHRGHRAIFEQVRLKAAELGLPAVVVTFDPQPREFFSDDCPARLTRLREKCAYLSQDAIDQVLFIKFNTALAAMPADDFVQHILVDRLNIRHLVVGDDFRFGHQRQGDYTLLRQAGRAMGFAVTEAATLIEDGQRISSSRVREALATGNIALAEKLLGHSYVMLGRVAHGAKLGRQLGFPTANIHLHRKRSPLHGIFAVKMHGLGDVPHLGVANIGTRPAVGGTRCLLEVHLFDFDQEIYGRQVQVEFCKKFRDEENYDSLEALKAQIAVDVEMARAYFDLKGLDF